MNDPEDPSEDGPDQVAAAETGAPGPVEPAAEEAEVKPLWRRTVDSLKVPVLAIISALLIGALVLIFTDPDTLGLWQNVGSDPAAAFEESGRLVADAYQALFEGSFGSASALSETLVAATPLILVGLAVGFAFRAGLFNIGGSGQVLVGSLAAAYVGFHFDWPAGIHLFAALLAGAAAGAFWAGIVGALKARTGAHEVISSIMLNYIALYVVGFLLTTEAFLRPGRADPITPPVAETAELSRIFGEQYRVTGGIIIALVLAVVVWWVLFRTTLGYRLRAVGLNPAAATYAGMGVAGTWVMAMTISGGLAGLGGAAQLLGVQKSLTGGLPTIGFDAIALALLGRSHPAGIVAAAVLFGALNAGGVQMQGATGTPIDMIIVLQALIIAFIAAPALIRAVWRIRASDATPQTIAAGWG